jgi:endoplasmic reticulum lectin 1
MHLITLLSGRPNDSFTYFTSAVCYCFCSAVIDVVSLFQVKLKCLENTSSSGAVALYLLEPRTCEYILGVESPLICSILSQADENGLIKMAEMDDADEVVVSSEDDEDSSQEVTNNFDNTIANGDD